MNFIIKLSPEITIKSKSVRLHFTKILTNNIRNILKYIDKLVIVTRYWDCIEVNINNEQLKLKLTEELIRIPGIHHIFIAEKYLFDNIYDICQFTLNTHYDLLKGKSFCVRVKRRGKHNFTSQDVEYYVGSILNENILNTNVKLKNPEEMILLEIKDKYLSVIIKRYEGLGGLPIGTQDDVLSLISGGFDSSVSSYMMIRRGCRVHYCFFNLSGIAHEYDIRKITYHLWNCFSRSHTVYFISINFASVVNEILKTIDNRQMGVVLKRMMIRIASKIAKLYGIKALITGESLGQVSSQTLVNLQLIDSISNIMILRPLISYDKEQIILLAKNIGTEAFTKNVPEYCSIISNKPTAEATKKGIEKAEKYFNFSVLKTSMNKINIANIRKNFLQENYKNDLIEITTKVTDKDIILDIRTQEEQENNPLKITNAKIKLLPFYKLTNQFSKLDQNKSYLLYCKHGVISQLHALYLREQGFYNIKIYHSLSA